MKHRRRKSIRVLGLAPSTRGFGFAVLDAGNLVDWGVRSVEGDKNAHSVMKATKLITRYRPDGIVIEDYSATGSRRAARILELGERLTALGRTHEVRVKTLERKHIFRVFLGTDHGTRHAVAEALTARFPEELGTQLPPKRRPWMSEDSRIYIFLAVALAVAGF